MKLFCMSMDTTINVDLFLFQSKWSTPDSIVNMCFLNLYNINFQFCEEGMKKFKDSRRCYLYWPLVGIGQIFQGLRPLIYYFRPNTLSSETLVFINVSYLSTKTNHDALVLGHGAVPYIVKTCIIKQFWPYVTEVN